LYCISCAGSCPFSQIREKFLALHTHSMVVFIEGFFGICLCLARDLNSSKASVKWNFVRIPLAHFNQEITGAPQSQGTTAISHPRPTKHTESLHRFWPRHHGHDIYFFLSLLAPFVLAVPLNSLERFFRCLRCCLDAFSILVAWPIRTLL